MPRRAREFVERAIYHVYCRTSQRAPLFATAAIGRSPDQVSRWAGQGTRRKADDDAFRRRLDRLDDAVAAEGSVWASAGARAVQSETTGAGR